MVRNERGAVIALVAVSLVVLLGIAGLALDAGRGYLTRAQLARAVDAGVLGGARTLRQGNAAATRRAQEMAALNGASAATLASFSMTFSQTPEGEQAVSLTAERRVPTMLMRVLGVDSMTVRASAEARVPPVDLVLVLDQSGSLGDMGAWDDLQDAALEFTQNFDESLDQLGMTSFQLRGTERVFLQHDFLGPVQTQIMGMHSAGDTNPGEGLRLALEQLTGPSVRERSAKVVVFFTDGRPTAFRGDINGQDRMMAVSRVQTGSVRGYFDDPDNLPTDASASPDGCGGSSSCFGWNENAVRQKAGDEGLAMADAIRSQGIYVYSIGLGNPAASNPLEQPDLDYLAAVANVDGQTNPNQPRGKAYFAPSSMELRAVFEQLAEDLLVRLSR